jgi:hypothetical protein
LDRLFNTPYPRRATHFIFLGNPLLQGSLLAIAKDFIDGVIDVVP